MKVLSGISVLALLMAGAVTPSFATSLAPGGTVTPTDAGAGFFGSFNSIATTGAVAYSTGTDSGTIQEWVGTWTGNPVAGDDMVFVYQVTINNLASSTSDAGRVTGGSFAGFNTDVFESVDGSGTTQPTDATRTASGVVVGFNFNPVLTAGQTSYLLIVDTNASTYTTGPDSVIDDFTFTNPNAFAPANTPEPSTLSLLGTGLLAAGAGLRRKMRRA